MRFRCIKCGEPPDGFLFEADLPACPRCHASGPMNITPIVDVHFIVMDLKGPIQGAMGRQRVACQKTRGYLAAYHGDTYAASDDPTAVTCRSCMGTREFQEMAALFPAIAQRQEIQRRMQADCCG